MTNNKWTVWLYSIFFIIIAFGLGSVFWLAVFSTTNNTTVSNIVLLAVGAYFSYTFIKSMYENE